MLVYYYLVHCFGDHLLFLVLTCQGGIHDVEVIGIMICDLKTNKVNKKTCDSLIGVGMCSQETMFRCTEYIARFEPRMSHSGITSFLRCPMSYYYGNVQGLQTRPEYQSDPMKIGSAVDDYITNILLGGEPAEDTICMDDIDCMWKAKAVGVIKAFNHLVNVKMVKKLFTGQREFLIEKDGQPSIKGFVDLHGINGKRFVELKVGKNPSYYTNLFYVRSKLAAYFMSLDTYEAGIMWAIRVPDLKRVKQYKDEPFSDHAKRCTRVIVQNPSHYFPGYSAKTGNFGIKFGRMEIDLKYEAKCYRMVADCIKLSIKNDVWVKNGSGCLHPFECDYLPICQNNGIVSDTIYTYRKKESRKEKMQS